MSVHIVKYNNNEHTCIDIQMGPKLRRLPMAIPQWWLCILLNTMMNWALYWHSHKKRETSF